jgi:phosphoenolpyruvate phosphomutase
MQAMILNSGIGKRMGRLTRDKPKCLIELTNHETILTRQLRLLLTNGINDIIITTGPFEEKIKDEISANFLKNDLNIDFVHNDRYKDTNYIYSMYLARNTIKNDLLLLHGDLVFTTELLSKFLTLDEKNAVLINTKASVPIKDFKGRVIENRIKQIGVDVFGDRCHVLMPMYKFKKSSFDFWMKEIESFVEDSSINVYAENALNNVLEKINLKPFEFANLFCSEVDDYDDLQNVRMFLSNGND